MTTVLCAAHSRYEQTQLIHNFSSNQILPFGFPVFTKYVRSATETLNIIPFLTHCCCADSLESPWKALGIHFPLQVKVRCSPCIKRLTQWQLWEIFGRWTSSGSMYAQLLWFLATCIGGQYNQTVNVTSLCLGTGKFTFPYRRLVHIGTADPSNYGYGSWERLLKCLQDIRHSFYWPLLYPGESVSCMCYSVAHNVSVSKQTSSTVAIVWKCV